MSLQENTESIMNNNTGFRNVCIEFYRHFDEYIFFKNSFVENFIIYLTKNGFLE